MNFVMSVEFSNGSTRVSVRAEDRSGATFLYRNGLFVSDPVRNLFGPASGSCQSLAELFAALSRRLAILSNLLPGHDKASGPGEDLTILGQSQPSGSDNPVAMLAQLDVTTVFVPFGDLAARAALAGPLDTDPAEGGVLPTMESLTTQQLRMLTLELGLDIMGNDPDRLAQFGRMTQGSFPLGGPQSDEIHRRIATGGAIAVSSSVGGVTRIRILQRGTPGFMDNPEPDPTDGPAE